MDVYLESLKLHETSGGKLGISSKVPMDTRADLTLAYTPGVAEPCRRIAKNPDDVYRYTIKKNTVAVITDGSAVLGLGNIGPAAGIPVMEGKCLLFKKFAGIDAFPICVDTQNVDEFVNVVKNICPVFGGINLEDIAAPRCFEIEERLKKIAGIPVFHDDQHGTAIVVLAGVINALKVTGVPFGKAKIVISGAGAAGMACTKLLLRYGARDIIVCDRQGAISETRDDIRGEIVENPHKVELARITNHEKRIGTLAEVLKGANVFIGVSAPGLVTAEMVKTMAKDAVVFAMANPMPEIMPDEAAKGGALIVGTGRSDFPNQINNVLAFPGIFRGVLDARAPQITEEMKVAAAEALAGLVKNPTAAKIIPGVFEDDAAGAVAKAVKECASKHE
jgi:malate dehydrogenase (oxaloacetate-decarboxylating)